MAPPLKITPQDISSFKRAERKEESSLKQQERSSRIRDLLATREKFITGQKTAQVKPEFAPTGEGQADIISQLYSIMDQSESPAEFLDIADLSNRLTVSNTGELMLAPSGEMLEDFNDLVMSMVNQRKGTLPVEMQQIIERNPAYHGWVYKKLDKLFPGRVGLNYTEDGGIMFGVAPLPEDVQRAMAVAQEYGLEPTEQQATALAGLPSTPQQEIAQTEMFAGAIERLREQYNDMDFSLVPTQTGENRLTIMSLAPLEEQKQDMMSLIDRAQQIAEETGSTIDLQIPGGGRVTLTPAKLGYLGTEGYHSRVTNLTKYVDDVRNRFSKGVVAGYPTEIRSAYANLFSSLYPATSPQWLKDEANTFVDDVETIFQSFTYWGKLLPPENKRSVKHLPKSPSKGTIRKAFDVYAAQPLMGETDLLNLASEVQVQWELGRAIHDMFDFAKRGREPVMREQAKQILGLLRSRFPDEYRIMQARYEPIQEKIDQQLKELERQKKGK